MVLLSAQGMDVPEIAKAFTSEDLVRDVIRNFNTDGFDSLYPRCKGGYPLKFTLGQRRDQEDRQVEASRTRPALLCLEPVEAGGVPGR
jgi:transposase